MSSSQGSFWQMQFDIYIWIYYMLSFMSSICYPAPSLVTFNTSTAVIFHLVNLKIDFGAYRYGNVVIGEDQRRVNTGQFAVRHFDGINLKIAVQFADFSDLSQIGKMHNQKFTQEGRFRHDLLCFSSWTSKRVKI